jgi:mono/diheme cytochrome c family protein
VERGRASSPLIIGADTNLQKVCVRAAAFLVLVALLCVYRVHAEDAAAKGGQIYDDYCATCHGEQLQNNSGGLTFDLRRLKPDEYPRFVNSVMNGKNKMPPWKGVLTETQINDLWAYIRATVSP